MASKSITLPIRLRDDARTATWNPALTRSTHVSVLVCSDEGVTETRRSLNSGRVRVREGERIEAITAEEA